MKPNIFISYSRREVGFVDELASYLEKEEYGVWLDYQSLVPGKPWEEQIYKGVVNSDVILLVVSKASITSRNVEMEWKRVIEEKNKRVILVIFEAVDLPKNSKNMNGWIFEEIIKMH
ncbi:MAG: toll/interleukin-1 receptor domain-containing protein [Anaerolineales bacterium]|nr:toll/interleukin-1 receptor domain-containing protein [Anaerolineales bacterium]